MTRVAWGAVVAAAGALLLLQSAIAPAAAWVSGERFGWSVTLWMLATAALVVGAWRRAPSALLAGVVGATAASAAVLMPETRALLLTPSRSLVWLVSMVAYVLCASAWLAASVPRQAVEVAPIPLEARGDRWQTARSAMAVGLLVVPAIALGLDQPSQHASGSDALMIAHGSLAFGWIVALFTAFIDVTVDRRSSAQRAKLASRSPMQRWGLALARPMMWLAIAGGVAWLWLTIQLPEVG